MIVVDFTLRVLLSWDDVVFANTIIPRIWGTFHVFKELYFRNSGLNFLLIQYTENIFFDPSFIENLSEKQKNSLLQSFDSSIYPIEKAILISEGSYYKFNLFEKNMDKSDS